MIALAIVGGVVITFMHFDPIRALYWSAVINGVTAVPIMIVMMLMARSRRVMGQFAVTVVGIACRLEIARFSRILIP